jgi:hypothetical protein
MCCENLRLWEEETSLQRERTRSYPILCAGGPWAKQCEVGDVTQFKGGNYLRAGPFVASALKRPGSKAR